VEAKDTIQRMRERGKDEPPHQLVIGPSVPIKMKAETGVCEWYTHRAKIWCRIVAALALQDGIWDWSMIEYMSDLRPHHALADGAIVVVDEDNLNIWAQLFPQSINDAQRAVQKVLQKRAVDDTIMSWEFKSISAASKDVMENVFRIIQLGSFRWQFCDDKECQNHADNCPPVGQDVYNPTTGLCFVLTQQ
jgi:hypothetical protein